MDIIQEMDRKIQRLKASRNAVANSTQREILEKRMTGTTILALRYRNGIIMAADRRCVGGYTIFSDGVIKIEEMGALACIAGAGYVSDFQILVEILRDEFIPKLEKFWEIEIFVDGQINLLKYLMRNIFLEAWVILGGWNPFKKEGCIFFAEPGGGIYGEVDNYDYMAVGSGGDFAKVSLKENWRKECPEEEGIQIAVRALLRASEIDRNTAGPNLASPTIKVVSSEKITDISVEKIQEITKRQRSKE